MTRSQAGRCASGKNKPWQKQEPGKTGEPKNRTAQKEVSKVRPILIMVLLAALYVFAITHGIPGIIDAR